MGKKEFAMFQVKNIMTRDVFTLNQLESLSAAKDLMNLARIRHIPIVDDLGHFVGLLTHRDILAATISELAGIDRETQDEIESGIPIAEIMQTDVATVLPDLPLKEAARLLLDEKYGCLPVICEDKLCGIITEADFLRLTIDLMEAVDPEE
jgi:CBS domain-containing protein